MDISVQKQKQKQRIKQKQQKKRKRIYTSLPFYLIVDDTHPHFMWIHIFIKFNDSNANFFEKHAEI